MKKIALDLDGVVFDSETLYRVYTEIYDTDVLKTDNLVDNTERIYQKRYNWSEEEKKDFYEQNAIQILESCNVMTGAKEVLTKLKDRFEFIVVTSRSENEANLASNFFNSIGLNNIKMFINEHDKIERLTKEKVDYIIDDDINTCINAASNGICAIYFRNSACKTIEENEDLKMANNWGEIYKYLVLKGE